MAKEINLSFAEGFQKMLALNVNEHTEQVKSNSVSLTYLSWVYAFAEATKADPNFTYEVELHEGKPYIYDPQTGYLVTTNVTMFGKKLSMWLPVMDSSNRAMKSAPYTYQTKYGEKRVESATMFDINKTIMRCLVKNLAMFGLGLYIYAGEDLPEQMKSQEELAKEYQEGLDVAIRELQECKSLHALSIVWSKHKQYQHDTAFASEKDACKANLQQLAQG